MSPTRGDGIVGRGKTFFLVKKGFSPPHTPPLFEKSEVCFAHVVRKTGNINLSYPYSRSERFTFAAGKYFTLRSNASRRIYPALHVGLQRKTTQSYPYSRSECFMFATGKRFTLQSNASCRIYPALHVGLLCKLTHPTPFRKKRSMFCSRCSQNGKYKLIISLLTK